MHNTYEPAAFSDDSLHVFDTYKTPLFDIHQTIYAALGIACDVTERLELETKLHQVAVVYDRSSEGTLITRTFLSNLCYDKQTIRQTLLL